MKKTIISLSLIFCAILTGAQVKMPQPSPTQSIKQDFALGNVSLTYSRPVAKGRKVFGDLVPYNKLWRTGANAATIIKFNQVVEINGKRVDTGSYALYAIPGEEQWEIILNKGTSNWGIDGYKETDDVVRFKTNTTRLKDYVESLTMQFSNILPESMQLEVMWEKTGIVIPIKANIKDRIRADLDKGFNSDKKPYWQAAQFYNEYDINYPKALENITKAVEVNPKAFWMWLYKAKIEKEMGNNAAALESSKKSMDLAREAKNDDYVKMNEDLQKKLK